MIEMLRDLIAHKGHATAALLDAIRQHETAVADPELLALLHHILIANRFWLLAIIGLPFVVDIESRRDSSFAALVQRYRDTQEQEATWIGAATDADLARVIVDAQIPGGACAVSQAWMQVCLHSQGHRAQCAKLLRRRGGVPPMTDFIAWLPTRTQAAWPT